MDVHKIKPDIVEPVNPNIPIELTLSVASVEAAIKYWLRENVLQTEGDLDEVAWIERERHFRIKLKRT